MAAKNPRVQPVYSNDQIVAAATGHWGEVAQEVKNAEPYVITVPGEDGETKTFTIPVLTRFRRKKLKASQATYLMMGGQLAEVAKEGSADQATISRIQGLIDAGEQAYDEALFGDVYQEIVEFFDPLPEEYWDAMYQDVHNKLVNRVEVPEDHCPRCGQQIGDGDENEGGPGKEPSSSTSSNSTGKKSKATSATTSD